MKRVLVVSQYYYPESFQINQICEKLVKDGYEIEVITGLPNYPEGKIFDGYTGHKRRKEMINGVKVERNFEIGRKKNPVFLILNYLSFSIISSIKYMFVKKDFDLVFIYQLSPVLSALPGIVLAKKYKKPILLYCCDIWPESIKTLRIKESNIVFKIIKWVSKFIYKNCDEIIVQSPPFIDYFKDELHIDKNKINYIPQFADSAYLKNDYSKEKMKEKNFVFLGNVGYAQNLELLIDSLEYVSNKNYKIHIVGDGSNLEKIKDMVSKKDLNDKFIFYGRQPVEKMHDFYKIADICFLSLRIDNKTGLTIPSKLQGYMAAGKPILAAIEGGAKKVIEDSNCGIVVSPTDKESLGIAISEIINNKYDLNKMGDNSRKYFIENFTFESHMDKLEKNINILIEREG